MTSRLSIAPASADVVPERFRRLLIQGGVLADRADESVKPSLLVCLEHAILDLRSACVIKITSQLSQSMLAVSGGTSHTGVATNPLPLARQGKGACCSSTVVPLHLRQHFGGVPMFQPRGPGKFDVLFDASMANILEALLYNFDFDDFDERKFRPLKVEHSNFLAERVIPLLEGGKGDIWIQGSASRIGSAGWNMTLSQVREGQVQAFLLDHGISPDQIRVDAVGSTLAAHHSLDDLRDRSVLLWVYPKFEFHPPPKKVPHRPKISRVFKIAVDGHNPARWAKHSQNISLGKKIFKRIVKKLPLSEKDLPFIVWDTTNYLACRYVYIDVNVGFDLSIGSKLPQPHGPWNSFTTEKPIGCWQFGRSARLTTIGDWKTAQTQIHIETPKGVNDVYTTIKTGITIRGVQGSFTLAGDFDIMEGPVPYGGP